MPLYEVHHIHPLSEAQRDGLAEGITTIHSEKFKTPRLFVNVAFVDASAQNYYVAGKKRSINRILATVRAGGGRTPEMFDAVCDEVNKLWAKLVGEKDEKELRYIFVLGSLIGGTEAGISIPQAGEDGDWVRKNLHIFKQKAADGDHEFADLLQELKSRGFGAAEANGH